MTGDWAEYGNDFKRSVTMVIDRINRMGGIHGKKVVLEIADSRGDPKESVLIAEKFVADPEIIAELSAKFEDSGSREIDQAEFIDNLKEKMSAINFATVAPLIGEQVGTIADLDS